MLLILGIGSNCAAPITSPRQHPFLLADRATFAQAVQKTEHCPWARDTFEKLKARAEHLLAKSIEVPSEGGQWSQYYQCKKCSVSLEYTSGRHLCPKCGTVYSGWPYDQVIIGNKHRENLEGAMDLALAYGLTSDERYATRAREILLRYADQYTSMPIHGISDKESTRGGRLCAQTLTEANTFVSITWAYDLIAGSPRTTAADRQAIEQKLLLPGAQVVLRNDMRMSNWQTWHNAALICIGLVTSDNSLVTRAVDGPSGIRFQLANSVLADGFWHEGTISYHYFALSALRWSVLAASRAGIPLDQVPQYKMLFDAPLNFVFPDLTFPSINDSRVSPLSGRAELYEIAYATFHDPRYVAVLKASDRTGTEALLWGVAELPETNKTSDLASVNFTSLGAAVLRQTMQTGPAYLHLDYGPHGGGHGHFDKLAVVLFACGQQLAPDPGSIAYSVPLYKQWYKETIAHNTVCVDCERQRPTTGSVSLFHSEPGFAVVQAACDDAYDGVNLRRTVVMTDGWITDVFTADSDSSHTYDWAYHNFGDLKSDLRTTSCTQPLGKAAGYQEIRELREAQTDKIWSADFLQAGANVRLTMGGAAGTRLFFGTGYSDRPPRDCPMIIARQCGKRAVFASVIEPHKEASAAKLVDVHVGSDVQLRIQRNGHDEIVSVLPSGCDGTRRQVGKAKTDAPVALLRADGTLLEAK